jgi:hypothetical protein
MTSANPALRASTSSDSIAPNALFANDEGIRSKKLTLLSGAGALVQGTLLGKITLGAVTETHAGNTGNGAMTIDVTTPLLANAQVGVYTAKCITATTNSGTFRVFDPKGRVLGDVAVAATFADQIKFVIADGSTDFIVGDTFLITVAAGSGKYLKSLTAAVDGSQYPDAILGEDADATSADVEAMSHIGGEFISDYMTFGTGHTAASARDDLRLRGIYLK